MMNWKETEQQKQIQGNYVEYLECESMQGKEIDLWVTLYFLSLNPFVK